MEKLIKSRLSHLKIGLQSRGIDFFKKFNATYGHDTGDEILRLVASIIKDVRNGGRAYLYGGTFTG